MAASTTALTTKRRPGQGKPRTRPQSAQSQAAPVRRCARIGGTQAPARPLHGLRISGKEPIMTERSTVTGFAAPSLAANGRATSVGRRGYRLMAAC